MQFRTLYAVFKIVYNFTVASSRDTFKAKYFYPVQLVKESRPGLLRRLAAIAYDCLLLGSILLVCAAPLPLLPEEFHRGEFAHWLVRTSVLVIGFGFFGWFWVHGGQTLGMRAWRLRVVTSEGGDLNWYLSLRRYVAALLAWLPLGLGFLWLLVDRDRLAWHDRLSNTRLVLLEKSNDKANAKPPPSDNNPAI